MLAESPLNIFFKDISNVIHAAGTDFLSQGFILTSASPQFSSCSNVPSSFLVCPCLSPVAAIKPPAIQRGEQEAPALCISMKSPRTERASAPGSEAHDN